MHLISKVYFHKDTVKTLSNTYIKFTLLCLTIVSKSDMNTRSWHLKICIDDALV
jgi:hypothetical protein